MKRVLTLASPNPDIGHRRNYRDAHGRRHRPVSASYEATGSAQTGSRELDSATSFLHKKAEEQGTLHIELLLATECQKCILQ